MSSPTLSRQSHLLVALPDRGHRRTIPTVRAVPPVTVEEDQVGGFISERQVIHPEKLHHRSALSACSLRIELADPHQLRRRARAGVRPGVRSRGRDDLCRLPHSFLSTRRLGPTGGSTGGPTGRRSPWPRLAPGEGLLRDAALAHRRTPGLGRSRCRRAPGWPLLHRLLRALRVDSIAPQMARRPPAELHFELSISSRALPRAA